MNGLKGATATMERLFRIPEYISSVGGKQEVMIGYSDSIKGKDDQQRDTGWARPSTRWGHGLTSWALAASSLAMGRLLGWRLA